MPTPSTKILFVTELTDHGDEGMRNWIKLVSRGLSERGRPTAVVRLKGDPRWSALLPASLLSIRRAAPDALVYVPYSGLTSKALVRHVLLRKAARARTDVLVTLQASTTVRHLPAPFAPSVGAFASPRLREAHSETSHDSYVFPPAVNAMRFCPSDVAKSQLRARLGLPEGRPMILHVGHLRPSRGLQPLAELARQGAHTVVVVASTATEPDRDIERMLRTSGVVIKREFLPNIEHWYQAADVYLFPVSDLQGSIEIPLTVLEAMACGVPVATTPFGGLPSFFEGTTSLRFTPPAQLAAAANELVGVDGISNRSAVKDMDLAALIDAFGEIVQAGAK